MGNFIWNRCMSQALLVAENLTKDYGTFRALAGMSLSLAPGEVVGLLGPNGSGKSTALRIMLGFLRADRGACSASPDSIAGANSVEARKHVAYLPGELRLYDTMTGRRLVTFLANSAATKLARRWMRSRRSWISTSTAPDSHVEWHEAKGRAPHSAGSESAAHHSR